MVKFSEALQAQPKALVYAEAAMLVIIIGLIDSVGGWDVSLFIFYAVPILLVALLTDRRSAILCAVVCAGVWFWAKNDTNPYGTPEAYAWATVNRLAYFLFVAIGGTAMKAQREELRARLEAMMRARELEQEIVRVSEHEQMRIGQDLHDGLCQSLAAINCAAACLRTDLEAKSLAEADAAEGIQQLLKEAVVEARDLARGIFPVHMEGEGLQTALEELVAKTNRLRQVVATLELRDDVILEDPQMAMHLYRIAQQALSNVLTHARSAHVVLSLVRERQRLVMTITDDGTGFAAADISRRGMGLRTMQYRARLIGADLSIESEPAAGTRVCCVVPLPS